MAAKQYRCFECGTLIKKEHLRKRVRCLYCGSKILYKQRAASTIVMAR